MNTNSEPIDITILCKVVDNFGDIGVTWRLAKHLREISHTNRDISNQNNIVSTDVFFPHPIRLRFVCDDLISFSKINNKIDTKKSFQKYDDIKIFDWNDFDFCYDEFTKNPPEIILECFQCGRPDWLEKILFDDQKSDSKNPPSIQANLGQTENLPKQSIWNDTNRIVNIIMIDYLSAEKYQEDFHCLKSLTRSAKVPKVNFMPGFTNRTGGLLLPFAQLNNKSKTKNSALEVCSPNENLMSTAPSTKKVLFFAYKNDWSPVVRAMNRVFNSDTTILIASGQGQDSILEACKNCDVNFHIKPLDFMNQEDWDNLMWDCDLLFVRGEDSLAQACLRGVPFIWQAYPQSEEYQTVKVKALLERMKQHFGKEFCYVENAWIAINENSTPPTSHNADNHADGLGNKSTAQSQNIESTIYDFLSNANSLRTGFLSFSRSLYENGDLAVNLMTFIEKNIIIA